jgi:hypothetical protein
MLTMAFVSFPCHIIFVVVLLFTNTVWLLAMVFCTKAIEIVRGAGYYWVMGFFELNVTKGSLSKYKTW